jgi:hypothetical protein
MKTRTPSGLVARRAGITMLVVLGVCARPALATRFVSTSGSDSANDCTSSASPCATPQHAVDLASPGEEVRAVSYTHLTLPTTPYV